jgi:hypothetical protein
MPIEEQRTAYRPVDLTHSKPEYAQANTMLLPRNYFVMSAIGSRNSGKTFAIVQLIKQMEQHGVYKGKHKVPIRTILISPTAHMNPVFSTLESLAPEDVHLEYSDALIQDIQDDIHEIRAKAEDYQDRLKLYNKMLKMRKWDDLTIDELMLLDQSGFMPPEPPKYPLPPVVNLILDDLAGTSAFRAGRNPLTNLLLRNRHHQLNIIIASQHLKNVPRAMRTNTNVFMIFKFANSKVISQDLYEEVSNILKEDELEELYEYATQGDHDYLFIDFTKPRDKTFRKNLDTFLTIKH